jgi:hypothetical protein
MATLFGHTQTLTSISKSVSAVAGGILGLQDNLANFMKKVRRRSLTSLWMDVEEALTKALAGHLLR